MRSIPLVPWPTIERELALDWKAGEHITIIGPTGTGKTHIAVTLADIRRHVMVFATKRRDPLVEDLAGRGFLISRDLDEITWTVTDDAPRGRPTTPKVVYWPPIPDRSDAAQIAALQARRFRNAINFADETGGWMIVVDETMYLADHLRLEKDLNHMWHQGRTQHLSVVALAQRPSRVPRLAFSSATYFFLAKTQDRTDIERLQDISAGFPKDLIEDAVMQLDSKVKHEFLFVDTKRDRLAKTVAPPR